MDIESNDHPATEHKKSTLKIRKLHAVWRYTLYIVPVCVVLAIPVAISFLRESSVKNDTPRGTIAEMEEKRFWVMLEVLWLACWLCVGLSYLLPWCINKSAPVVKKCASKTSQYNHAKDPDESRSVTLARSVRGLIALVSWILFSQLAFTVVRTWPYP
jgi:hypothetical protein